MELLDIRQLIGEATEYDKKQAVEVKKPKSWCKSVSAFANGIGGKLVWGIADDGTLVGLADAKDDSEKISEAIKSHIDPIPDFKLSFAKCEDKEFVILDVMPGDQTPYYYIGDGQIQAFVRVGNESVVASVAKHKELVLKGSNVSYDSQVSRWRFEDMAFTVLRATYFKRTNRSFEDSDYESFGIVNEKGELTNAGALLADYSPVRHSRLFCTRWNGVDKANGVMDAMDDEEYSGSLVTLLQAGMDFVRRNSKKAWRKTPDNRLEFPEYPERAVEEGLVNALIHRNYLELGSEIHIDMYDDRLEIFSPGGLMDGGSIKDMDVMKMPSRRRNPVLADVFNRLKYMERRGSGFKKIISAYKEHEGYKEGFDPAFSTPWDSFVLTLPKFNVDGIEGVYISNGDDAGDINEQGGQKGDFTETLQKLYRNLTQTDKKIIELIVSDNFITTTQMAAHIGKSRQTIATRMKELQDRGIVKRNGPDNGGFWEIVK
ncbi:MAG: putative DNA binding domain-containing protein [Bacteroidales bacterium]|nr:putative DNA binding domain-containing protein [Bacteroidales bacterium]